jgi:hypothetical protein
MINGKRHTLEADEVYPIGYHSKYYLSTDTACTLTITLPSGGTTTQAMATGEQYIYDGPIAAISPSVDCGLTILSEG